MKKFYVAVLFLLLSQLTIAQNSIFKWAKHMGGISNDCGHSITTDAGGNVYTTGRFEGTADFDPGVGTANLTSAGGRDIFIQKLDTAGNFLWVKQIGGTSHNWGYSITTDAGGNVYATGNFKGTADFDPGAGTVNLTSAGYDDIFIQKLDGAGNFLWAKKMGGASYDRVYSITIDAGGNVYTTGYFEGTVDFDPGAGTTNLISAGYEDIFIQKLDSAGNLLWAKQMGGTFYDYGRSITTDADGNVYTTGYFKGTVDFDPGAGIANLTSLGVQDIFIQKLDTAGNLLWVKQMGGTSGGGYGYSITTGAGGNIYTTGGFGGIVDFDPGAGAAYLTSVGQSDIFIQKLDGAGNLLWVKQMGGTHSEFGYSITTDAGSNIYTTGGFGGTVDFDPGAGTANLTSASSEDIFIQKLDSSGNLLCVKQMGGTYSDQGFSITTDAGGNVYTTGYFKGTVDFNPGAGTTNLTSAGGMDVFIQKLSQCIPSTGTDVVSACDSFTWIDGITYAASNNIATHTLSNAGGCDSVVTLDLTVNYSNTGTYIITACFSYTWIDGITYTASNNIATHTLSNVGGCDSVVTLNLTIITIDNTVSKNGAILTANEIGANYQWLDCNNSYSVISGASNQSFTATSNGNYAVEITKNSCVDTSNCYSITNIGIIENSFGDKLVFYPNPTSGIVNLEFGSNYKNVQIIIRNSEGKLVKHQEFKKEQNISIEIEGSKGIYLIEVISADKKAIIKVVKQ